MFGSLMITFTHAGFRSLSIAASLTKSERRNEVLPLQSVFVVVRTGFLHDLENFLQRIVSQRLLELNVDVDVTLLVQNAFE